MTVMSPPEPEEIARFFSRDDGSYHFARWGRPIVPVIFGVEEQSLPPLKGAIEAVVMAAGHRMAEVDPELGTNLMIFFLKDWEELTALDNLDRILPELGALVPRLIAAQATQYRLFRFDEGGAIRAAFVFLRLTAQTARLPAEEIGLEQAAKMLLDWGPHAFATRSPLIRGSDAVARLHPHTAGLLQSAYDPVMPESATDPVHALRLFARMSRMEG
jgi:hypothetical protein